MMATIGWAHVLPSVLAAFLASLVEFVEALTVVLAVGSVRGWRAALTGAATGLLILLLVVLVLGPALSLVPLRLLQGIIGVMTLLFGLRWLRKAILRAAGRIPLHDEAALFAKETARMRGLAAASHWDSVAFATSLQITLIEGMEVVFIVIAIGAGGAGLLAPAATGAVAALLVVVLLGLAVHRPLANVPENTLKFIVGVLISAFGTFWVGEALALAWPGDDWSLLALAIGYALVAALAVARCRTAPVRVEAG